MAIKSRHFKTLLDRKKKMNLEYLDIEKPPEKLLYREVQQDILINSFSDFLVKNKKPMGIDLMLYGKSGTGKTALIKMLMPQIEAEAQKNHNFKYIYIQANDVRTHLRFLQILVAKMGLQTEANSRHIDVLLESLSKHIQTNNLYGCIVLDEIDKIKTNREFIEIMMTLSRFNGKLDLKASRMTYIVISNDTKEELDIEKNPALLSSFQPDEIVFKPYKHEELTDITKERIKLAFKKEKPLNAEEFEKLVDYVYNFGDMRVLITLLKRIATKISNQGTYNIEEIINTHKKTMERKKFEEMSYSELKAISPFLNIRDADKYPELTAEESYELYTKICREENLTSVNMRQYKNILKYFREVRILQATNKQQSRKKAIKGRPPLAYRLNINFDRADIIFSARWNEKKQRMIK